MILDKDFEDMSFSDQRELCLDSHFFDYYHVTYPDVVENNSEPLGHYLVIGDLEGCNPNPAFETTYYVSKYGHGFQGLNPLVHFILKGRDLSYSKHSIHPFACRNYGLLQLYFDNGDYLSVEEQNLSSVYSLFLKQPPKLSYSAKYESHK